jgi:hypothetical protein
MNYKLELNTQEIGSNVVFNNIIFDFIKLVAITGCGIMRDSFIIKKNQQIF